MLRACAAVSVLASGVGVAVAADCVSGQVYDVATTCTVPTAVSSIKIEAWGGGGPSGFGLLGNGVGGGGGGGGSYCGATFTVTAGDLLTISPGAESTFSVNPMPGNPSSVSGIGISNLLALGGSVGGDAFPNFSTIPTSYVPGSGGSGAGVGGCSAAGAISFPGGDGSGGGGGANPFNGGGGGSATAGAAGGNAGGSTGGQGQGAGGNASENGYVPGGGAGAYSFADGPKNGARGRIVLTFTLTPIDGVCGTANGQPTLSAPNANLCLVGTAIMAVPSATMYGWSCVGANGGNNASCAAPRQYSVTASPNPASGGGVLNCAPTSGGAAGATAAVTVGETATCTAMPDLGYSTASISGCGDPPTGAGTSTYTSAAITGNCAVTAVFAPTVGTCGAANGVATISAPTGNLCAAGTASAVAFNPSSYDWTCTGENGGSTATCSALRQFTVTAVPNPASGGGALNCAPTNGGALGASAAVTVGETATCTATPDSGFSTASVSGCSGAPYATNTYITAAISGDCTVTATFAPTTVGSCGTANGVGALVAPAANLCAVGTASAITVAVGAFNWACEGSVAAITSDDVNCASVQQFTVTGTASPVIGGAVACDTPVNYGAISVCSATANANFTFAGWGGACTGAGACAPANITANQTVSAVFAPFGNADEGGVAFVGATATGSGTGSASFTSANGGPECRFDASATGFIAAPATIAGRTHPHGHFRLRLMGCAPGFSATVSVTWPSVSGLAFSKYGKATVGAGVNSHFTLPAGANVIINAGMNIVSFVLTDGQVGDDDGAANGEIVDPVTLHRAADSLAAVPALNGWAHLLLALLLLGFASSSLRRRLVGRN